MNFKNFSIILALLTFELKVFSLPVNNVAPEKELSSVEILESEISTEELSPLEISDFEIVTDEKTVVEVVESNFEDTESDEETTEIPTDSVSGNDLPCNDIQECIDWMKKNKDVLVKYDLSDYSNDEVLDYLYLQYQDEKNVKKLQENFEAVNYGKKVDVDGRKMSVNIKGEENNTTIVILPGLGIPSPVLFYKNIAEILAKDFKVVTIEPFGYGVSDLTDKERTAENIVSEIHDCLTELEIDQFYVMGHSIGGIYSILYDNTFKNKVLGFIGLDNTPNNYDNFAGASIPDDLSPFFMILDKYHLWGLAPESQKKALFGIDTEQQIQNYSDEELETLMNINNYRFNNPTLMDESNHTVDTVASAKGLYFNCPLLMFTSDETGSLIKEWYELHENMIKNNPNKDVIGKSKVIRYEETKHVFIHTQKKKEITDEIKKWIN